MKRCSEEDASPRQKRARCIVSFRLGATCTPHVAICSLQQCCDLLHAALFVPCGP